MTNTDSLKTLAKRYSTTPAALRETARDLGLTVGYDSTRRTWTITENASLVTMFNRHLAAA